MSEGNKARLLAERVLAQAQTGAHANHVLRNALSTLNSAQSLIEAGDKDPEVMQWYNESSQAINAYVSQIESDKAFARAELTTAQGAYPQISGIAVSEYMANLQLLRSSARNPQPF